MSTCTRTDWKSIAEGVHGLLSRNQTIFAAGGEILSGHFAAMEQEKGVPEGGYLRRPLIGLRIPIWKSIITAKPGFEKPRKEFIQSSERIDGVWNKLPEPRYRPAQPGRLLLGRVELELVTPRLECRLAITEDGAKCLSFWPDPQRNLNNMKTVASALYKLIDNPSAVFSAEAERCCNCGKPLTVATSRLRGIGPECIRFFSSFEQIAAEVKAKYRSLDDEWWVG